MRRFTDKSLKELIDLEDKHGLNAGTISLWLDDLRDPNKHGCIGWTWVTTADEAIALLATGTVKRASLDHDLTVEQTLGRPDNEKTGYTVICWMEENDIWPPEGTRVHSQNPVGREKMNSVIKRAYGRLFT